MRPRRDHLTWGVAFASGLYIVGFLLTRRPATIEVQVEFDERMLRATATVEGLAGLVRDRRIWAHQENHTARNLIVDPSTGTRREGSFVFASSGESIRLELLREPEEAERVVRGAYFDPESASCIVPLSYLGLPREEAASIEYRGKGGIQVQRGLVISGPGWVRTSGAVDVLATKAVAAYSGEAGQLVERGMETLRDWNLPQAGVKPLVVLLPKGSRELGTHLHLQEDGVYVLEVGELGLLTSTIFRDLARAACERVARVRPPDEQVIWNSLGRVLAARIAMECSLHGAEEGLEALVGRYAVRPRELSLHVIPENPAARWRLENVIGPVYWNAMLRDWPRDGNALRDLFASVLGERRGVSLREAVTSDLGHEIAAHVE